jgi:hypothetical protein
MKLFSSRVLLPVLALAAITSAHAQLSLTGSTHGVFTPPVVPFTTVVNGPVISTFASGIPSTPHEFKTSVKFTGSNFAGVQSGDSFSLGTVKITNGVTKLGSTATMATMDLLLNIPAKGVTNFNLTTLSFALDNTSNNGFQNVPDLFFIGNSTPNTLKVANTLVLFNVGYTDWSYNTLPGHPIPERKSGTVGLVADVRFVPVPEPSTYALFGALGLVSVVAYRRFRGPATTTA